MATLDVADVPARADDTPRAPSAGGSAISAEAIPLLAREDAASAALADGARGASAWGRRATAVGVTTALIAGALALVAVASPASRGDLFGAPLAALGAAGNKLGASAQHRGGRRAGAQTDTPDRPTPLEAFNIFAEPKGLKLDRRHLPPLTPAGLARSQRNTMMVDQINPVMLAAADVNPDADHEYERDHDHDHEDEGIDPETLDTRDTHDARDTYDILERGRGRARDRSDRDRVRLGRSRRARSFDRLEVASASDGSYRSRRSERRARRRNRRNGRRFERATRRDAFEGDAYDVSPRGDGSAARRSGLGEGYESGGGGAGGGGYAYGDDWRVGGGSNVGDDWLVGDGSNVGDDWRVGDDWLVGVDGEDLDGEDLDAEYVAPARGEATFATTDRFSFDPEPDARARRRERRANRRANRREDRRGNEIGLPSSVASEVSSMGLRARRACVLKRAATDAQAQAVLDYACNPVHGLSCAPIKKGGRHFVPNTKRDHAEWAIDQFFKRRSQEPDAFPQQDCHFVGVATLDVPGNFYLTTRGTLTRANHATDVITSKVAVPAEGLTFAGDEGVVGELAAETDSGAPTFDPLRPVSAPSTSFKIWAGAEPGATGCMLETMVIYDFDGDGRPDRTESFELQGIPEEPNLIPVETKVLGHSLKARGDTFWSAVTNMKVSLRVKSPNCPGRVNVWEAATMYPSFLTVPYRAPIMN